MNPSASSSYLTVSGLLKPDELESIDLILKSASFEEGAATATDAAKSVKKNLQLPKQGSEERKRIGSIVINAMSQSPLIHAALMPKVVLTPIISRYEPGMHYGHHVDSPLMADDITTIRTDVGMTLFLSDPSSYEGGELEVITPAGPERFKLERGDAIFYPTTAIHGVIPVTSGVRLAAVTWMQCAVRDAHQREILFQLKSAQALVDRKDHLSAENLALMQVHSNLVRMWAEL